MTPRWPAVIRWMHWMTVALAAIAVPAVLAAQELTETDTDRAETLAELHMACGLAILVLTLARLAARLALPRPAPADRPLWLRLLGALRSVLLYGLLLALPATGILKLTLSGLDVTVFGFTAARAGVPAPALARALAQTHALLGQAFIALVFVHATTAILHRRLFGTPVLQRMS